VSGPRGHDFTLMGLAFIYPALPTSLSCIRPEFFHLINMFCMVIVVKKCIISSSGSLLLFCTAYHQNTVGAYDQSYTFAQSAV